MYTIQHKDPVTRESKMQDYDAKTEDRLFRHLAAFPHEIFNIFRDGNMVTKTYSLRLLEMTLAGRVELKSEAAKNFASKFINCPP